MTTLTIARWLLFLAAMDGYPYPDRLGYWVRAAHQAGISVDEIVETIGIDKTEVEHMLRKDHQ